MSFLCICVNPSIRKFKMHRFGVGIPLIGIFFNFKEESEFHFPTGAIKDPDVRKKHEKWHPSGGVDPQYVAWRYKA